jgi:hypothetical protein
MNCRADTPFAHDLETMGGIRGWLSTSHRDEFDMP